MIAALLFNIERNSFGQGFNEKLSEAVRLSEKGLYAESNTILEALLESSTATDRKLIIYKQLYDNTLALEQKWLHLSKSVRLAKKSLDYNSETYNELKGLLAEQALQFYNQYKDSETNEALYNAVYYSLKSYGDPLTQTHTPYSTPGDIYLINSQKEGNFYSVHQNGSLMKWSSNGEKLRFTKHSSLWNRITVKTVKISPDGTELFMAGTMNHNSFAELFDMRDLSRKKSIKGSGEPIIDACFDLDNNIYLLDDYGRHLSIYKDGRIEPLFNTPVKLTRIYILNNGSALLGTGIDGNLYSFDIANDHSQSIILKIGNRLESVTSDQGGETIAVGDSKGLVYLKKNSEWIILAGHTAGVQEIVFSNDNKYLATASYDKTIRLYKLENLNIDPIILKDNTDRVTSIMFSSDNKNLLAATYNKTVKSWPVDISLMNGKICNYLSRNFTKDEWNRFIGDEIDYQMTCNNINNEIREQN